MRKFVSQIFSYPTTTTDNQNLRVKMIQDNQTQLVTEWSNILVKASKHDQFYLKITV